MPTRTIVYWRDIPAQIIVREGRVAHRRELPERFIQAIDQAAMRVGAKDSDAYLAEWRRGAAEPCGADMAAEADAAAADLDLRFDTAALRALVRNDGRVA